MTGRFTVVSERGDRVFRQGDAAVLWRMARGKEDDRCAGPCCGLCSGFACGFVCRSVRRGGCGGRRPESETCKIKSDMRKTNVMQIVRLVMMIAAVAGVIYALEYMERGIAVWFWITLLGVGFVGLLYTFRLTQRRVRLERRAKERQEKKKSRRQKR